MFFFYHSVFIIIYIISRYDDKPDPMTWSFHKSFACFFFCFLEILIILEYIMINIHLSSIIFIIIIIIIIVPFVVTIFFSFLLKNSIFFFAVTQTWISKSQFSYHHTDHYMFCIFLFFYVYLCNFFFFFRSSFIVITFVLFFARFLSIQFISFQIFILALNFVWLKQKKKKMTHFFHLIYHL